MRTVKIFLKTAACLFMVAVMISLTRVPAISQPEGSQDPSADKTLSPYFFVRSDDPALDRLPLKATSADVSISGVIADVRVSQVYRNEGKKALEAIYIFPASTRAAVYGMKMTIGERTIKAKINKREDARREYEQALQQGRSASLLEQQRPNVFQMNVGNIMPGDEIKVELKYTELLVPTDGVYEFAYPTVVGPRYSNQPAQGAPDTARWLENPYLHEGENPNFTFNIAATIKAGMPVKDVSSPSHKIKANFPDPATSVIGLDGADAAAGKKDFILRYRLAGNGIQSGMLLYEGKKENFFLLMVQPPGRVRAEAIPPREYIFIVDVSGSMYGFPLEISKKLMKDLVGNLRDTDKFNVLLFSGGSALFAEESVQATRENVNQAVSFISRQTGGGGTELLPAMKRALQIPRPEGFSRTVVIATDGYVAVEAETFDLIRAKLGSANMFAFGIGSSVNRHLIEGMARVGMGESFVITKPDEAPAQAEKFRAMIQSPVLTGVKVDFGKFKAYDVEPPAVPDVLAQRPVIVFGKWKGSRTGKINITGTSGSGAFSRTIDVSKAEAAAENSALRHLWARHRIAVLGDYNSLRPDDKRTREITSLGLEYNLLTAYTSFVAVDSRVRNSEGGPVTVRQPLPLPQGVSNYAVGQARLAYAPSAYAAGAPAHVKAKSSGHGSYRADALETAGGYAKLEECKEQVKKDKDVRIEVVKVKGALSRQEVIKSLEQQARQLGACGKLSGKLVLSLKIAADGSVKEVKLISGAGNAAQCIRKAAAAWSFAPAGGETRLEIRLAL
jgi:Ca-activated chloride channel family protein